VDNRRKKINKIGSDKEVSISIIKGVDSMLDSLSFEDVVCGFDKKYNEVIFSIDDKTIAYNEVIDVFVGTYTFTPGLMLSIKDSMFSIAKVQDEEPWMANIIDKVGYVGESDADENWDYIILADGGESNVIYKHDVGEPGNLYGDAGENLDSYITLIINPDSNVVNVFDNLDLRTDATTQLGVDVPADTFYKMEAFNSYQDLYRDLEFDMAATKDNGIVYNDGSIKRIARIWRTPIMQNQSQGTSFKRMVDTYIKVKLSYDNTSGNNFKVHDVVTLYRNVKA